MRVDPWARTSPGVLAAWGAFYGALAGSLLIAVVDMRPGRTGDRAENAAALGAGWDRVADEAS